MENKENKKQNPVAWICCHNAWKSACQDCIKNLEAGQKLVDSLSKKQRYLVSFSKVTDIEFPGDNDPLPLLEKIAKEVRQKFTDKLKKETTFFLPLTPEVINIDEKKNEVVFNFYNRSKDLKQSVSVPITLRAENIASNRDDCIGVKYKITKMPSASDAKDKPSISFGS